MIAILDFFECLEYFYPDPDDYNGNNDNVGICDQICGFCCCSEKVPENENELDTNVGTCKISSSYMKSLACEDIYVLEYVKFQYI